jgi:hypothetical protein
MNILINNFVPTYGVKDAYHNEPIKPYGIVVNKIYSQELNVDLAITNVGIIYFRYPTSTSDSPYGWMDLRKFLLSKPVWKKNGPKDFDFDLEYRYATSLHCLKIRSIGIDKSFTEFKTERQQKQFNDEVLKYKKNILKLYETIGQGDHYRLVLKTLKSEL